MVVFSDAPEPEDDISEETRIVCVQCLLDEHPEIVAGLNFARLVQGEVEWSDDADEWVVFREGAPVERS